MLLLIDFLQQLLTKCHIRVTRPAGRASQFFLKQAACVMELMNSNAPQPARGSSSLKSPRVVSHHEPETFFSRDVDRVPVKFSWVHTKDPNAKVDIAGTFTSWKTIAMTHEKASGNFVYVTQLPPGHYQYKFIVNGEWRYDGSKPVEHDFDGNVNNKIDVTL